MLGVLLVMLGVSGTQTLANLTSSFAVAGDAGVLLVMLGVSGTQTLANLTSSFAVVFRTPESVCRTPFPNCNSFKLGRAGFA